MGEDVVGTDLQMEPAADKVLHMTTIQKGDSDKNGKFTDLSYPCPTKKWWQFSKLPRFLYVHHLYEPIKPELKLWEVKLLSLMVSAKAVVVNVWFS
jgi:hypothetical protein